jgi:hypothetical protein
MGGRIYDPILGRFFQADPFIQAPINSQSYNRFAYVLNNPMSYTDPSGYFFVAHKTQQSFLKASVKVFGAEAVGIAGNLATIGCGIAAPVCAAHFNYNFNRAMGVSTSGSLRAGFTAAISAYTFQQIGSMTNISQGTRVALHAFPGGITSELQGGKFGHGFINAGLTKAIDVNGMIKASQASGMSSLRIVTAAVIEGTISRITGGKFANGAITAAFAQAFNGEEQAKYEDALAELQNAVHEDANRRKDQIIKLTQQEDWNKIRNLYPHLDKISDNKMFLEALNLHQKFSRISKETLPGKVSYELDSKIGKPARLAIEIYIERSPRGVIDAFFNFLYSPELPVEHQFIYGRETVDYEYVRREYE